jgi:rod shape determining protein RodA
MSLASLEWGSVGGARRRLPFSGLVIDVPLLLLLLMIVGIGFVVLYSALGADAGLLMRQGLRFAAGLVAFFGVAGGAATLSQDSRRGCSSPASLLVVVMVEGDRRGAQRWLDLGFCGSSRRRRKPPPMMVAWRRTTAAAADVQTVVMVLIVMVPAV